MTYRNTSPQAPLPSALLAVPVATPDHVWRARLAREQADKLEALDQAQVDELIVLHRILLLLAMLSCLLYPTELLLL